MKVLCPCGQELEVDVGGSRHETNKESATVFVGAQKCTNPQCKLTVYVDAIISAEIADDTIDWDKIKVKDTVYHDGLPYEVALKSTIESKRALYLKSILYGEKENVIGVVDDDGEMTLLWWVPECKQYSRTSVGLLSWSPEDLK